MAGKKATATPGKRASKTAEGAAPRPRAKDAPAPQAPRRGRPLGSVGKAVADGRTERIYVSVKPAQKLALEDELLELKRKRLRPANYALSQYVYEKLFPTE